MPRRAAEKATPSKKRTRTRTRKTRAVETPKRDRDKKKHKKRRTKTGGAVINLTPTAAGVVYDGQSLDDWDDEELIRGRRRNKHGGFTGRPPLVVPAAFLKELNRRRFSRAYDLMADSLADAALMLRAIVNDKDVAPSDRIRAAEVMFDRVVGKPKESVSFDVQADTLPWQKLMAKGIVATMEDAERKLEEEGEIVDGELVEEDGGGGTETPALKRRLSSSPS